MNDTTNYFCLGLASETPFRRLGCYFRIRQDEGIGILPGSLRRPRTLPKQ